MTERMIEASGVSLCTEAFGDPADAAMLLIAGLGSSMLWWEEGLCRMLAHGGRFVVRYDHRDTGRSESYQPGHPPYTGADLVADAGRVLDAFGIASAHVVGVSAGGGFAQLLALGAPDRVRTLTLVGTSPVAPGDRTLPGPTVEFGHFASTAAVDWSDGPSVVEYLVGYSRVLNGPRRSFDETAAREFAQRDVARTRNIACLQNHDVIATHDDPSPQPSSSIRVPTLVIHGTADPVFPLEHGEALVAEIPDARLLPLDDAGHGVFRPDWNAVAAAVVDHTGRRAHTMRGW